MNSILSFLSAFCSSKEVLKFLKSFPTHSQKFFPVSRWFHKVLRISLNFCEVLRHLLNFTDISRISQKLQDLSNNPLVRSQKFFHELVGYFPNDPEFFGITRKIVGFLSKVSQTESKRDSQSLSYFSKVSNFLIIYNLSKICSTSLDSSLSFALIASICSKVHSLEESV